VRLGDNALKSSEIFKEPLERLQPETLDVWLDLSKIPDKVDQLMKKLHCPSVKHLMLHNGRNLIGYRPHVLSSMIGATPGISELSIRCNNCKDELAKELPAISAAVCAKHPNIRKINIFWECSGKNSSFTYIVHYVRDEEGIFVNTRVALYDPDCWSTTFVIPDLGLVKSAGLPDGELVEVGVSAAVLADAAEKKKLETWLAQYPMLHTVHLTFDHGMVWLADKGHDLFDWLPKQGGVKVGEIVICCNHSMSSRLMLLGAQGGLRAPADSNFCAKHPDVKIYVELFDTTFYVGKGMEVIERAPAVYQLLGDLAKRFPAP
jgi:hypothetical protein